MTNLQKFAAQQLTKKAMNEAKGGQGGWPAPTFTELMYCEVYDGDRFVGSNYVTPEDMPTFQKQAIANGYQGHCQGTGIAM